MSVHALGKTAECATAHHHRRCRLRLEHLGVNVDQPTHLVHVELGQAGDAKHTAGPIADVLVAFFGGVTRYGVHHPQPLG